MEIKILDSNILIYMLLENHPANQDCASYVLEGKDSSRYFSIVDCLDEFYYVLNTFYGIKPAKIMEKINQLLNTEIQFLNLSIEDCKKSFEEAVISNLQIHDMKLYLLAQKLDASIVVTDDKKFRSFLQEKDFTAITPIQERTRIMMNDWEKKFIPKKGLSRVLLHVFKYLDIQNPELSESFRSDTESISKLPLL